MIVKGQLQVSKNKKGEIWTNFSGSWKIETKPECINIYEKLLHLARSKRMNVVDRNYQIDEQLKKLNALLIKDAQTDGKVEPTIVKASLSRMLDFFTEFDFEPNFRFVNTVSKIAHTSHDAAKDYIINYFDVSDKLSTELPSKLNSREFNDILDILGKSYNGKDVNTRFRLFYGSQGTGKTTKLLTETQHNVIPCHSAMLPSDLMEDFEFVDGKAIFKPSALQIAMVEGKKIGLDEINLLPFESLRFLQSILDNKSSFVYKGKVINIKEGFEVIGSMNLYVNGSIFALPEPLVDRASALIKFKLDAETLYNSLNY